MSGFGKRKHPWSRRVIPLLVLVGLLAIENPQALASGVQGKDDVAPDATPQIRQITPDRAAAGSEVSVDVEGRNFSAGAYITSSSPAIRVVSTRRLTATHLQADLVISIKAQAVTAQLFVSNPASAAAPARFEIVAGTIAPPTQVTSAAMESTAEADAPGVTSIQPPRAARGAGTTLKVKGKKFAPAARVSFSNPGILVLGTQVAKSSELTVRIQVAPDAPTGFTGLFVVNPDDSEAEARFEVTDASPAQASKASSESARSTLADQRFEVINLGDAASILQNPSKASGTLILGGGKLRYQEESKEVFSACVKDVEEIGANQVFGMNTGTFHIILTSGKTYNFAAPSFRPADTQAIIDSLRRVLH